MGKTRKDETAKRLSRQQATEPLLTRKSKPTGLKTMPKPPKGQLARDTLSLSDAAALLGRVSTALGVSPPMTRRNQDASGVKPSVNGGHLLTPKSAKNIKSRSARALSDTSTLPGEDIIPIRRRSAPSPVPTKPSPTRSLGLERSIAPPSSSAPMPSKRKALPVVPPVSPVVAPRASATVQLAAADPSALRQNVAGDIRPSDYPQSAVDKPATDRPTCKDRPDSAEARKGPGGSRPFIPWCKKG